MHRRQLILLSLAAGLAPVAFSAVRADNWSQAAFVRAQPLALKAVGHPFLQEAFAGTLPERIFAQYLAQNRIYLVGYARCLGLLSERLSALKNIEPQAKHLKRWGEETLALKAWTDDYIKRFGAVPSSQVLAATADYMTFEHQAVQTQTPAVAMAALLPCFWIYNEFGRALRPQAVLKDNPYSEWVEGFGTEASEQSTREAAAVADRLAAEADDEERNRMTETFLAGCRHELALFDAVSRS